MSERWLLFKTLFILTAIRLGLWFLPFSRLLTILARFTAQPPPLHNAGGPSLERTRWSVVTASRYVPRATCLVQALAAQVLLARDGRSTHLRFGVNLSEDRCLMAHAWLECEGGVVVGESAVAAFTSLSPLPAART